jgi:two-component system, OmpR family, alkaline phosphatase synthesis response regulator PhoP
MSEDEDRVQIDALVLVPSSGEAQLDGRALTLTKTEFRLLLFLACSDGSAIARKQIIEAIQGADYPVTEHSIDTHVMGLRRKLGAYGRAIETVRGVGYRYRTQQQARLTTLPEQPPTSEP